MITYVITLHVPVEDGDTESILAVDRIVAAEVRSFIAVASLVAQKPPTAKARRKGAYEPDPTPLDLEALNAEATQEE